MSDRAHGRGGARRARPGAHRAPGRDRRPRRARAARTSSRPRSSQLYGEGARADLRGARRATSCASGSRQDGVVASLHAHPRPLPGRPRDARARGAGRACARTWSPTAATSSCWASRTASRGCGCEGSCDGCAASAETLELAIEQALRGRGARPARARRRGRRRAAAARPSRRADVGVGRRSTASPALARGQLVRVTEPGWSWPTSPGTLLAYRDRCAGCGGALASGALLGGTLTCAACGAAFDLPRAGRCRNGDGLQLDPVPLLRNSGAVRVALARDARRGIAALAAWREPPSGTRRARGAGRATCELCPIGDRRGPPPPAAPRTSGASSACARRAGRCARATPSSARRASRTLWLDDFALRRRAVGGVPDPDRPGLPAAHSVTGRGRGAVPEPGRRDGVRARPVRRGTRCATANPVLERLEPDAEALIVNRLGGPAAVRDRADRPVLPPGRADQVALGGHLRRARRRGRGRRSSSSELRARALRRDERRGRRRRRPLPPSRCSRCSTSSRCAHAATPTLRFHLHVTDPPGARSTRSRCRRRSSIDPARRAYDAETRERLVELFGAPERWGATTQVFSWAHVDVLVRASPARRRSRSTSRAPTTSRSPPASTSTRCPTARCRCRSTSTGWCSTAARRDRLQVAQVPWSCTARWRCPSRRGSASMAPTTPAAAGCGCRPRRSTRSQRARRSAGDHSFDATVADAAGDDPTLDELVDTLLWEGHALYPYTPGATKNATPTPFGIVYPPAYAAGQPAHLRPAEAAVHRDRGPTRSRPTVLCLQGGEERRVELPPTRSSSPRSRLRRSAPVTGPRVAWRARTSTALSRA